MADRESPSPGVGETKGAPGTVAALLAETRRRQGLSVEAVAEALRIRSVYLAAIEAGRLDDLPGRPYALGFVRAYAEHLGLDGEEAVRRFKLEAAGLDRKTELVFPSPLSEGRFPGRVAIAASIAVAIAVYGLWHFSVSRDRSVVELVPPPPQQTSRPEAPPDEPAPETERKPAEGAEAPAEQAAAPQPGTVSAPAPAGQAAIAPPATPAARAPAPAASPQPASATPAPSAAPSPAPAPASAQDTAAMGAVYGSDASDVRVVLTANAESWIQVMDSKGNVAAMRLLKRGESFRVPNQAGLTLFTGNAGGLDVMVDGKPAPALGAPGSVRRNIVLDPARLLAGG